MGSPDAHRPPSVPCDCSAAAATCASVLGRARRRGQSASIRPTVAGSNSSRGRLFMRWMLKAAALLALAGMAGSAVAPASAQETKVAVGISGWTGFAPLTLAKEAGIFKKNGLDVDHQEDPAEGPPPRHRLGRRAVRGDDGRDLDRLERQRRRDQADLPARQELRRRRHGRAQRHREDRRPEGQDGRRVARRAPRPTSRSPGS